MDEAKFSSPILYQSRHGSFTLYDIPASISLGEFGSDAQSRHVKSIAALEIPYRVPEGKPEAAVTSVDAQLLEAAERGLTDIAAHFGGPWCLKRYSCSDEHDTQFLDEYKELINNLTAMANFGPQDTIHLSEDTNLSLAEIYNTCIRNTSSHLVKLTLIENGRVYLIPEHSTFILGPISLTRETLLLAVPGLLPKSAPYFDFVVIDPPWPNRSAIRKAAYNTDQAIRKLLRQLPIRQILAINGLLGIWVTNKDAYRNMLGEIFRYWGVKIEAEWIWIKTTTGGEPVTNIQSSWRKPWEVLFLARRSQSSQMEVTRRVIAAVPDLHSRKPNLRVLIEPLLPQPCNALEIFARNLTPGWWAWGDEAIKYNDAECWAN